MAQVTSNLQILNNYDPTHTTTLRAQFAAAMTKRFRRLRGIIRKAIIEQDCFGLINPGPEFFVYDAMTLPGPKAFDFRRSSDKVDGFMEWLKEQEDKGLLEISRGTQIGAGVDQAWTNQYIQTGYQKGVVRARQELKKAGYDVPEIETGGQISAAFNQPFHLDRVGLLYSRTYNDLKGITSAMDSQISRVLAQGIADGASPKDLAKLLTRTISGPMGDLGIRDTLDRFIPAERRAVILARTEIIRAHHSATIQEYKNWGVAGVQVKAEWTTAGDVRVCDDCAAMEGQEFTLKEIENKIPRHPQCRCIALPVDLTGAKGKDVGTSKETQTLMGSASNMGPCVVSISNYQMIQIYSPPAACTDYYQSNNEWMYKGKKLNEIALLRIKKMGIPPAWKNVIIAANPSKKIQAIGMDIAGRWQYRYSAKHIAQKAQEKFKRSKMFAQDLKKMRIAVNAGMRKGDARAYLLKLEDLTAIRAGSITDFKAKKKAYGLTTLQHEHLKVSGNKITLQFVAKEGIAQKYVLQDAKLSKWLAERKASTQVGERLFPDVPANKLNTYMQDIAGGKKYTIKDFRTYHGTHIAVSELEKYLGKAYTVKEKKKIVKDVSMIVSKFLHNTPGMAKKSYIDPMVWEMIGGL